VFREEKLIVAISGKHHQTFLFPTIVIEGMNAEAIKIDDTKGCNLFCIGKLVNNTPSPIASPSRDNQQHTSSSSSTNSSSYIPFTRLLCVAIKKVVSIYEINSSLKPKYKKLRDIELTMNVQSMQIINNQLCIGFQSEFALYSLAHENAPIALLQPDRDKSLQFLIKDPINALLAVQITNEEYLLVFESKSFIFYLFFFICSQLFKHFCVSNLPRNYPFYMPLI
jgi:serine/threonine-protein kinase MRCK